MGDFIFVIGFALCVFFLRKEHKFCATICKDVVHLGCIFFFGYVAALFVLALLVLTPTGEMLEAWLNKKTTSTGDIAVAYIGGLLALYFFFGGIRFFAKRFMCRGSEKDSCK